MKFCVAQDLRLLVGRTKVAACAARKVLSCQEGEVNEKVYRIARVYMSTTKETCKYLSNWLKYCASLLDKLSIFLSTRLNANVTFERRERSQETFRYVL